MSISFPAVPSSLARGRPRLPHSANAAYQLLQPLGAGGFGAVWLALHRPLKRLVALKVLHAEAARMRPYLERFVGEARLTAAVRHPHVVRVLDHDVEDGVAWIAYEYLGGETLRTALDRGPLPLDTALDAGRQLADALAAVHAHAIVHRDLKPENVLVPRPGLFKLIDFGVALGSAVAVRTGVNTIMGTPAYVSPEQLLARGATPRTDQYQLGLLLHQLIAGTLPFQDGSVPRMLARRLAEPAPALARLRPGVPDAASAAVSRLLAIDPADRFPDMAEAGRALDAAHESLTVQRRRALRRTRWAPVHAPAPRATPRLPRFAIDALRWLARALNLQREARASSAASQERDPL